MTTIEAPPVTTTSPSRGRRMLAPLVTAGGVGAATLALHLRDPHVSGSWGVCPFTALTGLYCPGCGGLRAVNDLTNLDVAAAASSNLLFVASIPLLLTLWVWWLRGAWTGGPHRPAWVTARPVLVAGVVLVAVFTVLRNLPASYLAP